jgi:hypothetical protein
MKKNFYKGTGFWEKKCPQKNICREEAEKRWFKATGL